MDKAKFSVEMTKWRGTLGCERLTPNPGDSNLSTKRLAPNATVVQHFCTNETFNS